MAGSNSLETKAAAEERSQQGGSASSAGSRRRSLLPLLLLAATFLVHLPVLNYEFVYDDRVQIEHNPNVQAWSFVPSYFTGDVWAQFTYGRGQIYYRPFFLLTLRLLYAAFGQAPFWWHLVSLLAHGLATWLVFRLARELLGDEIAAFFAALIFGLHPANLESVAWISAISEPLLVSMLVGSLLAYRDRRHVLSLSLCAAATLMKETAVVFPLLLLGYMFRFESHRPKIQILRAVAPYVALTAAYIGVRILVTHGLESTRSTVTLHDALVTVPNLLLFYLRHLIWPDGLSMFYQRPVLQHLDGSLLLLLAITTGMIFAIRQLSRARYAAAAIFACILLVIPLLPVLYVRILPSIDFAHDRYLYLPLVGFSLLVAIAIRRLPSAEPRGIPVTQILVMAVLSLLMGYGAVTQSGYWRDDLSLFQRGIETAPDNPLARTNLGFALAETGEVAEAIAHLQMVIQRHPGYWQAYGVLGSCYAQKGDLRTAEYYYAIEARLYPAPEVLQQLQAVRQLLGGKT